MFLACTGVLAVSAMACGSSGESGTPGSSPAADSTGLVAANSAPSAAADIAAAELEWARQVCEADQATEAAINEIPGLRNPHPSILTLAERKARVARIFPQLTKLDEAFVERMNVITPPASGAVVHAAIKSVYEARLVEISTTLADIDRIHVSLQAIDADAVRTFENVGEARALVNQAFESATPTAALFSLRICSDNSWD